VRLLAENFAPRRASIPRSIPYGFRHRGRLQRDACVALRFDAEVVSDPGRQWHATDCEEIARREIAATEDLFAGPGVALPWLLSWGEPSFVSRPRLWRRK